MHVGSLYFSLRVVSIVDMCRDRNGRDYYWSRLHNYIRIVESGTRGVIVDVASPCNRYKICIGVGLHNHILRSRRASAGCGGN